MKTLLYGLTLILVTGSAWAIEARRSPQYICSQLSSFSDQAACNQIISEGGSFNGLALGVCEHRAKSAKDTLECMRTVQYGKFQSEVAIWACDRMEDADDAIGCLGAIKKDHIDDGAVLACERIDDPDDLMECLYTITDKTYKFSEIQECKGKTSNDDMIGCFEERGEDGPREKQYQKAKREWDNRVTSTDSRKVTFKDVLKAVESNPNAVSNCIPKQQDNNVELVRNIKNLNILIQEDWQIKKDWQSAKVK